MATKTTAPPVASLLPRNRDLKGASRKMPVTAVIRAPRRDQMPTLRQHVVLRACHPGDRRHHAS